MACNRCGSEFSIWHPHCPNCGCHMYESSVDGPVLSETKWRQVHMPVSLGDVIPSMGDEAEDALASVCQCTHPARTGWVHQSGAMCYPLDYEDNEND